MSALALDPVTRSDDTLSTPFETPLKHRPFKNSDEIEEKISKLLQKINTQPKSSIFNWKNVSAVIAGPILIVATIVAACFYQFTLAVCLSITATLLLAGGANNIYDRNKAIQKIETEKKEISDISEMVKKLNQLNQVSGITKTEKKQIIAELKIATKDFKLPNEVCAHLEMIEKAIDSPDEFDYDHNHTLITNTLIEKLDRSEININYAYMLLSI